MDRHAIIVAGGRGKRMESSTPKQFLKLQQKPLLFHTLEAFQSADPEIHIILVLPADHILTWEDLCQKHNFSIKADIVEGGESRFHSVKNGLQKLQNTGTTAVHDGVRPLATPQLICKTFQEAETNNTAIPVLPVKDSLRYITDDEGSQAVNRSHYRTVQTPQCFQTEILQNAYQQDYDPSFTDDASVIEKAGGKLHFIEGEASNIKITSPFDLQLAECLIDRF